MTDSAPLTAERTCNAPDCDRALACAGLCWMHYQRVRKHGSLDLPAKVVAPCSAPDCDRLSTLTGLCGMHYQRKIRHGSLDLPVVETPPCGAPGCDRDGNIAGLCSLHYQRMRKHGSFDLPVKEPLLCSIEDCDRTRYGKNWCTMHYQRYQKHGDPLVVVTPPDTCPQGHLFDEANTGTTVDKHGHKSRYCRTCRRDRVNYRRALKLAAGADRVESRVVYERDGWVCGLCEGDISRDARFPDPLSASVDHVIPITRDGGTHTYDNVQAAHLRCNLSKQDRTPDEYTTAEFQALWD